MKGRLLFEFRHQGRIIAIIRTGRGSLKRYTGFINGQPCVTSLAKGDLLRELILLARNHPKTDAPMSKPPVVRRSRSGRPRAVAR
jgi:hypothetical protein